MSDLCNFKACIGIVIIVVTRADAYMNNHYRRIVVIKLNTEKCTSFHHDIDSHLNTFAENAYYIFLKKKKMFIVKNKSKIKLGVAREYRKIG